MRTIFLCLAGVFLSSCAVAAPRFHATLLDTQSGRIKGYCRDGSALVGGAILYSGQYYDATQITGYHDFVLTNVTTHDIFSGYGRKDATGPLVGLSYYKGVVREIPKSPQAEFDTVTGTNINGDFVGYRARQSSMQGDVNAKPFLVHNGVMTFLQDYPTDGWAEYATGITDGGIVYGNRNTRIDRNSASGWYRLPGSTTRYTNGGTSDHMFDDGWNVGGPGVYVSQFGQILASPLGPNREEGSQPDMNSSHQVVFQTAGTSIVYWDTRNSYYLNDLVENPEVLPALSNRSAAFDGFINDSGSIICNMLLQNSFDVSLYRFDPVAVPEPSSILVLGIGALALRRRSRS